MKPHLKILQTLTVLAGWLLAACSDEKYVGLIVPEDPASNDWISDSIPIRMRHKDAPLKILAIGNSFTDCSIHYLPRLIRNLNGDSLCVAKLVRSGASLSMHWANHKDNISDYKMYYSDYGEFMPVDITTIDDALRALDWDIIVIQQVSGMAGVYSSYQPYLPFLLNLFRESNPDVVTAWQYTWAYMPGTDHKDFYRYEYDSEKMYAAVVSAADRACSELDIGIRIPSAILVKRLRDAFPQEQKGFTNDGYHIDMNSLAAYALSALWYEKLVAPTTGTSSIGERLYFDFNGMEKSDVDLALDIVAEVAASE